MNIYKHHKLFIFSLLLIILISCSQKKKQADIIVHNAKIYTVDNQFNVLESFAIKKGKFIATGSNDEILNNYKADEIIDLKGKYVYPGLIDAHCHFYSYGLGLRKANLTGTKSFQEILQIIQEHHKKFPCEWIVGRGWDQNNWQIKEFPDKTELDNLFPDIPVLLIRIDGHAVLANSEALKRANITKQTKVSGGIVEIKNNKLTGILIDNAVDMINGIIPEPDTEEKKNALINAQENCFAVGLTTISDAGLNKEVIELMDYLQKCGELKMRIYAMLRATSENLETFMYKGIYKTDYLNVRSVKLFADGALGSRGACLIENYCDDPGNFGLIVSNPDFLKKICEEAYNNKYQINTHAIGDSAVRLMLNIYGEILSSKGGQEKNDLRWRIEHSQVVHTDDFHLYKKYSIIPSVQTTHATSDMYWAEDRVGGERIMYAYAYKQLLEQNGWLANGSDFPVEDINPLYGFYAAIARKDLNSYPEDGFQMENALTRKQALKAMTIWAAKANFEKKEKGSIEPGKFADFVVTDEDIMTIEENKIPRIKVLRTFIGGKEVYSFRQD